MQFLGSSLAAVLAAVALFSSCGIALPAAGVATLTEASVIELLQNRDILQKRGLAVTERDGKGPLCKIERAVLPVGAGPVKLSDAGNLQLKLVVIGRGTQNYTCADSTANSKPVANGALAKVYDASCFAVNAPAILHWLPAIILHTPDAIPYDIIPEVGTHYFHPDASTPIFDVGKDLVTTKTGFFVGKKAENVPAPTNANIGILPDAFGAVDWLKLVTKSDVVTASGVELLSNGFQAVYRVHTAGGKAPPTCEGRTAEFAIQYATEYWLYN